MQVNIEDTANLAGKSLRKTLTLCGGDKLNPTLHSFPSKDEFISFQFSTSVLSSDLILPVINARVSVESLELL